MFRPFKVIQGLDFGPIESAYATSY